MTAMVSESVMTSIPQLLLWTLWTASWQAGVMAGIVWLACRLWPRMPANLRVMLWWLVSLKFVIGLVWTQPIPLPILPAAASPAVRDVTSVARVVPATDALSGNITPTGSNGVLPSIDVALAGIWLLGVIVQGVLLARQLVRTRQLIARSQPVEGAATELFDDLVNRLGVAASQPRLRVSAAIATPQVIGLIRPVVLLPVDALESFSARELSLTLCHELMHVKRFDLWHGWIPSVAARLFFFHPLARLAAREYAIAREAACDARVLAFTDADAYDYGRLLMRLGATARHTAPAAAGASPTLHTLKRRLLMLHDASPHARGLSPRWWALAAIATLLVIPLRPTAAQPADTRPAADRQPVEKKPVENSRNDDHAEPWVYVQDDENAVAHGSAFDVAYAKRLRTSAGPLIYFKRNGIAYVIRDLETLGRARGLFAAQEELHMAILRQEERQTILGDQQTALRETQETLQEQVRVAAEMVKEAAAATQKTIAPPPRPSEDDRMRVGENLRLLEARLRDAEANQLAAAAHQEAVAQQQRALTDQQTASGAEQAAIRRQLEEREGSMEREMRILIDNALAAGRATTIR